MKFTRFAINNCIANALLAIPFSFLIGYSVSLRDQDHFLWDFWFVFGLLTFFLLTLLDFVKFLMNRKFYTQGENHESEVDSGQLHSRESE